MGKKTEALLDAYEEFTDICNNLDDYMNVISAQLTAMQKKQDDLIAKVERLGGTIYVNSFPYANSFPKDKDIDED